VVHNSCRRLSIKRKSKVTVVGGQGRKKPKLYKHVCVRSSIGESPTSNEGRGNENTSQLCIKRPCPSEYGE